MGPKAFITCYVCFREFGSRSIPFHEPKCLERWRQSNRNLPPEKRSSTPVKPIGWKSSEDTWLCPNCRVSVPTAKRGEHAASCFNNKARSGSLLVGRKIPLSNMTAGTAKSSPPSPKKGKENKNSINKSDAPPVDNIGDTHKGLGTKSDPEFNSDVKSDPEKSDGVVSTSNKSVRPQTKILRRPTPNLKHPVIQVESDDSGDSSDKSKEENPKRMRHSDSEHKPKNFIMYNKYNVERNTKNSPKERTAVSKEALPTSGSSNSIPYPCNSCSRNFAPERLHSHTRKDARGLMMKKASSTEVKTPSPQKKVVPPPPAEPEDKKPKEVKNPSPVNNSQKQKESDSSQKTLTVPKAVGNLGAKKTASAAVPSVCYICGKDPSPSSLALHETKCLEKWKRQNGLLSPNRRKAPPQKAASESEAFQLDEQLDDMDPAWLAVQSQLVPCPTCSRTFFPERLPVHQRVCKGKVGSGQSLSRANSLRETSTYHREEELGDKQSIYVPCYICGRNFGSWVIQMHESQCLRKWRRENEKLPEHLQQQEPHKPQLVLDESGREVLEQSQDVAWESHLQQLVPCQRCGRTFFPDRLQVHGRSCKGQTAKQLLTPRTKTTSKAA